jgi:hypothetical protein
MSIDMVYDMSIDAVYDKSIDVVYDMSIDVCHLFRRCFFICKSIAPAQVNLQSIIFRISNAHTQCGRISNPPERVFLD